MKKFISFTTLFVASLLFSGCSAATSEVKPSAKIEQNFNKEMKLEHVKASILDAAKKSEWEVENSSLEEGTQITLKKTYEQRRTVSSHPAQRNLRETVSSSIYATLSYTPKGFEIQLSDAAGLPVQCEDNKAKQDISALKEAIITQLNV